MVEAIRLEDVWFGYDRDPVIRGVTLVVREGEKLVILGPNGAGKTTLLKILGLMLRPWRGRVIAWGLDYWSLGGREALSLKRRVVYVGEKPVMASGSVLYNVALGLLLRGVPRREAVERAREAAKLVGIEGLLDKPARSLSRGQAQLVSIARALAVEPRVLLLDEPSAHLDSRRKAWLAALLSRLVEERGVAVVVATHDYVFAERLGGRLLIIEDGVVRGSGGAHHSPSA